MTADPNGVVERWTPDEGQPNTTAWFHVVRGKQHHRLECNPLTYAQPVHPHQRISDIELTLVATLNQQVA
jgi:hypothetical protein